MKPYAVTCFTGARIITSTNVTVLRSGDLGISRATPGSCPGSCQLNLAPTLTSGCSHCRAIPANLSYGTHPLSQLVKIVPFTITLHARRR
ncbi:hypothetical protein RRG08_015151 [Elysia crispata]|uniref:Uncharacterized protein n=1 Tax=Elysia crispata TaxID=231223 RepID=A0AAE1E7U0_9GAST|nr:hypothetical protein RRG08_015151 [Elysia crispata]